MPRDKRERPDGQKDFKVTIGGICVENPDGELSFIRPIAQYDGISESTLQKMWRHLQTCEHLEDHQKALSDCVLERMTEFGDLQIKKSEN